MWEIVFFTMDLFFEIRWEIRPFYDLTISDFIRLKKTRKEAKQFHVLGRKSLSCSQKDQFWTR